MDGTRPPPITRGLSLSCRRCGVTAHGQACCGCSCDITQIAGEPSEPLVQNAPLTTSHSSRYLHSATSRLQLHEPPSEMKHKWLRQRDLSRVTFNFLGNPNLNLLTSNSTDAPGVFQNYCACTYYRTKSVGIPIRFAAI